MAHSILIQLNKMVRECSCYSMEVLSSITKKRRNSRLMSHPSCEITKIQKVADPQCYSLIVVRVHQCQREVLARTDGLLALDFTVACKIDLPT